MQIERDDEIACWLRCVPRKTWAEQCREIHAGKRRRARTGRGAGFEPTTISGADGIDSEGKAVDEHQHHER